MISKSQIYSYTYTYICMYVYIYTGIYIICTNSTQTQTQTASSSHPIQNSNILLTHTITYPLSRTHRFFLPSNVAKSNRKSTRNMASSDLPPGNGSSTPASTSSGSRESVPSSPTILTRFCFCASDSAFLTSLRERIDRISWC